MSDHGPELDELVGEELSHPKTLPPSLSSQLQRRDPFVTGMALLLGIVLAGFVLIALGKRSLARTLNVSLQLPGLVSGCIGGVALVAVGAGLAVTLHSRRLEAELRLDTDETLAAAAALVAVVRANKAAR